MRRLEWWQGCQHDESHQRVCGGRPTNHHNPWLIHVVTKEIIVFDYRILSKSSSLSLLRCKTPPFIPHVHTQDQAALTNRANHPRRLLAWALTVMFVQQACQCSM